MIFDATISPHVASRSNIAMASKWAEFYRFRGYQPLPSSPEKKRPIVRYRQWWDEPCPPDLFSRHPTSNVQVMTGRRWGLLVIDLDGETAIEHWKTICPSSPRTWITHSGGGGRHLWFTLHPDTKPLPKARLWGIWDPSANAGKGDWEPRAAIERLGDRSLVMAPPSIHPKTGRRYRFLAGSSPREIARPAMVPAHVLALDPVTAPRPIEPSRPIVARKAPSVPQDRRFDWRSVLGCISDKIAVARRYGLRFATTRPNASGWCECHAIGREDRNPSASFNPSSGRYWEPDKGSIGFFDLLVQLGGYANWRDACDDLGATYCPRRMGL